MSSWRNTGYPSSLPGKEDRGYADDDTNTLNSANVTVSATTSAAFTSTVRNVPTFALSPPHPIPQPSPPHPYTVSIATTQPSNNSIETNGPRAKCDQVVFEAIAKAAEIVVGSRCWIDPTGQQQQQQQQLYLVNNTAVSSNTANSSRFNLFVPEVQGVRSILQRWRRALHVPLRLDVHYQHPDGQRELLERWCLEYAPTPMNGIPRTAFGAANAFSSPDPIVQLRIVCKNIVIWLRTLYCWSRMLPSQSLRKLTWNNHGSTSATPIGFSIYVVSEGQDDVTSLVSIKGFSSQGQPHCVPTPYGELGWKVFYAPKHVVQRLLPKLSSPYFHHFPTNGNQSSAKTITKPQTIPVQCPQTPMMDSNHLHNKNSHPPPFHSNTSRSAPQHDANRNLYRRANSDFSLTMDQHTHTARNAISTDVDHLVHDTEPSSNHHQQRHHYLQKAHKAQSSGGIEEQLRHQHSHELLSARTSSQPLKNINSTGTGLASEKKNLSGLSLALMLSEEQSSSRNSTTDGDSIGPVDKGYDETKPTQDEGERDADEEKSVAAAVAAAEKRRAALHHAPPQFHASTSAGVGASPIMTNAVMAAGEYGYAYNNHIPALQNPHPRSTTSPVTPNTNNTSTERLPGQQAFQYPTSSSYTTSPSLRPMTPLGTTPPGYLLSATPSASSGINGPFTPSSVGSGGLIPPRSAVTPPFVRPMGFVGEAPTQPLPSPPPANNGSHGNIVESTMTQGDLSLQQHQTSLDLLHSSPFQYLPSHQSHHPMNANSYFGVSSQHLLPIEPNFDTAAAAPFLSEYYHHRSGNLSSDDYFGRGHSNSDVYPDHDWSDDMPFAVDPLVSSGTGSAISGGGASGGGVVTTSNLNAGLASIIHDASLVASMMGTAAPKRLAMFHANKLNCHETMTDHATSTVSAHDHMASIVDSLTEELADLKSFGASLIHGPSSSSTAAGTFAPEAPTASAGSG